MENVSKKYTCPMHPEVVSDTLGRCPKCGMALVQRSPGEKDRVVPQIVSSKEDRGLGILTWRSYIPLIVIILMILVAAIITGWQVSFSQFILNFMTGFFLVFAGFKLMDLNGFAEGYSTYDLLAQRWFAYGYSYPFIELAFGFLMLAGYHLDLLLWIEFGVMTFSGLGVASKLARGEQFQCACLGTFLKVPLTKVTLIEDFGMAILALAVIFYR